MCMCIVEYCVVLFQEAYSELRHNGAKINSHNVSVLCSFVSHLVLHLLILLTSAVF